VGCTVSPVVIAQNNNFTLVEGHTGGTPVTVVTTSSNSIVPSGKFFCLVMSWVSGGSVRLEYDHDTVPTNFHTPSVIFIPEWGLALIGVALVAPLWRRIAPRKEAA
jgi:hypothetical protein